MSTHSHNHTDRGESETHVYTCEVCGDGFKAPADGRYHYCSEACKAKSRGEFVRANSPSDNDPSNTRNIRQAFLEAVRQAFNAFKTRIRQKVGYPNDALNLKEDAQSDFFIRQEFTNWMEKQIREDILKPINPGEVKQGKHWTAKYLRNSFITGFNTGVGRLFQQGVNADIPDTEALLSRPFTQRELESIYFRAYENLKDITRDTATQIRQEISNGYTKGWNPRKTATRMVDEIEDLQHTRAEVLARTATIDAAADGALASYENAGVETVGHSSWLAADDDRTCPYCNRLDGEVFTISEMRNTLVEFRGQTYRLKPAAHPRGRCSPAPAIGYSSDDLAPLEERLPAEATIIKS